MDWTQLAAVGFNVSPVDQRNMCLTQLLRCIKYQTFMREDHRAFWEKLGQPSLFTTSWSDCAQEKKNVKADSVSLDQSDDRMPWCLCLEEQNWHFNVQMYCSPVEWTELLETKRAPSDSLRSSTRHGKSFYSWESWIKYNYFHKI